MLETDLAIIGAGPAGMAAAYTAAQSGLSVLLLDEQSRAGGQIYRDVERAAKTHGHILGKDYTCGLALVENLKHERITHVTGAAVWQVGKDCELTWSVAGKACQASGKRLLIATGALERPMPVPGWTLPGVMTAGAWRLLREEKKLPTERGKA